MAGLCDGSNEPPGSLKASRRESDFPWGRLQKEEHNCMEIFIQTDTAIIALFVNISLTGTETFVMRSIFDPDRPAGCWSHVHMPKQRWTIIQPELRYRVVSTMVLPAVIAAFVTEFRTYHSSPSASRCIEIRLRQPSITANHTIPPFWLDDRSPLRKHMNVRPAVGCWRKLREKTNQNRLVGRCRMLKLPYEDTLNSHYTPCAMVFQWVRRNPLNAAEFTLS
ncbi:hypothetical protein ANN_07790 [Periplaneta americana]|uniref:Uncharacterized protein n=1 Tax=Periplaneta americana TaxID=6978 RepID=A0ABQ8SZJ7_PERAM|nr:hypothetical protein ANN_07790 [Periplaneta americana]